MATCRLYLYRLNDLKDNKNFSIDYIDDYLPQFQIGSVINDFQFQRIELYKTIKINYEQIYAGDNALLVNNKPNYIAIVQDRVNPNFYSRYFYFVTGIKQLSQHTLQLELKMDVLNTYNYGTPYITNNYKYKLSNRSLITREHKDRMSLIGSRYVRIVDKFQEGIEAIQFKDGTKDSRIESGDYGQWYVVFKSQNAVVDSNPTQADYVNPVLVEFVSEYGYTISASVPTAVSITADDIPQYEAQGEYLYINLSSLGASDYVEINGTRYTNAGVTVSGTTYYNLWIEKTNNTDPYFSSITIRDNSRNTKSTIGTNVGAVIFYGINSCQLWTGISIIYSSYKQEFYIGSGSSGTTATSPAYKDFDLTDPRIIKVINFPYCPREDLHNKQHFNTISNDLVWNNTDNCLQLKQAQNSGFTRYLRHSDNPLKDMIVTVDNLSEREERNIKYESKLYHSDFYTPKFVYDSFSFQFRYENLKTNNVGNFTTPFYCYYVCSPNIQSKFMFQFDQYVCDREIQDYNDVMVVERNNEKAIYTNAYINYIRSGGFRYDSKNADMQKLTNGLTIGLSAVGATASFISSIWTGGAGIAGGIALLGGIAGQTINAIHQAQQNDRQISQKLMSASQQSSSVSTCEDVDILKTFSGNKAKFVYYEVSSYLKEALWNLFHYFGYKCQYYGVPNIKSRCNFNFVQGDVILEDYIFDEDIANEIKKKWKEGITFFHKGSDNTWDLNQEYENFETNLLTEV